MTMWKRTACSSVHPRRKASSQERRAAIIQLEPVETANHDVACQAPALKLPLEERFQRAVPTRTISVSRGSCDAQRCASRVTWRNLLDV